MKGCAFFQFDLINSSPEIRRRLCETSEHLILIWSQTQVREMIT